MEMAPLMHTVDRKVVLAEAEGNAAEEEHFVDDDVALAAAKDAPEDQISAVVPLTFLFGIQNGG